MTKQKGKVNDQQWSNFQVWHGHNMRMETEWERNERNDKNEKEQKEGKK